MTKNEIKVVVITVVAFLAFFTIALAANQAASSAPALCLNATLCN